MTNEEMSITEATGGGGSHNHPISSVAGTNAPYVQYTVCVKN